MTMPRTILITGANRGIGLAILQVAATRLPHEQYILGSRSVTSGAEAIQGLRTLGIEASISVQELDVSSDVSIAAAVEAVSAKYGKLDVLINNAGIAIVPTPGPSDTPAPDFRSSFNTTFDVNVTSIAYITTSFLPLLRASPAGQVINLSSARGSLGRSTAGKLPPSPAGAMAYHVSKTALNALTVAMQKDEKFVRFSVVSPGHCRTAFNGFRGKKDPEDGAEVVVRLLEVEVDCGQFWEVEGGELVKVPW